MPNILDNLTDKTRLRKKLEETFGYAKSMDVATGYFNLRGWQAFSELVDEKYNETQKTPVARILIGMLQASVHAEVLESSQRELEGEQVDRRADRETARKRRDILVRILREQLMRGIPTPADRRTLQALYRQVQDGLVEIKVYTEQPLHGKTYIFHDTYGPVDTVGYVGSSNLTLPGLTRNLELNTDVTDIDASRKLAKWFEDRWTNRWSLKVSEEILELIDESWATPHLRSPYDVYLKVCHDLSTDVREGLAEYTLTGRIADELLEYQHTAVKTLAKRIMKRGGTMLGDVVGLGKTLTAIAVALMLRDEYGYQPLVICPKNLQAMWEEHLESYDLNGRVVPYSMSRTLRELRRYPFVIIDESHTLRNEKTQRYQDVQQYIMENDSKALLLTATPYNIEYTDVANQLGLFIDEDEDLGIQPIAALKKEDFADKLEFGLSTLAAFRKSDEPEDWKRLMGENLVRRTRSFIKANYAKTNDEGRQYLTFSNGAKFFFPNRVAIPIDHRFSKDDPAEKMVSDETLDAIKVLKLPRYDLFSYVSPAGRKEASEDEVKFLADIERSRGHVSGFVRTNFYKRLSSCGHSFMLSLKRHMARNRLFMFAIDNDFPLPVGTIDANVLRGDTDQGAEEAGDYSPDEATTSPADDYELLQEKQPAGIRWIRPSLFVSRLRQDLEADNRVIEAMLRSFGEWSLDRDSKLQALFSLVTKKHPDEKILIFTEYKDTANYIGRGLQELGVDHVGVATGDSENPTAIARRFAPDANSKLVASNAEVTPTVVDELRVLVATDVLSEGQNLQDAHIVVNYDIPWAIIQLIQRAGRVDRVGQMSDTVLVYSVTHGSVEDVLNLRKRVQRRLAENAATFGSDEQFFDTEEEIGIIQDLYSGHLPDEIGEEEDVDASSLAYEIWTKATKDNPDLEKRIRNLPDMIDATKQARIGQGEGVACHVQTESGIDSFGWADENGLKLLTGHEALKVFEAHPGEEGLERLESHDDLLHKLVQKDGPLKEQVNMAGRLRGERKILWNRLGDRMHEDPEVARALDALYTSPLTKQATNRLRSARRRGATDDDLFSLLKSLNIQGALTIDTSGGKDPIHIVSSIGVRNA